MAAKRGTYRRTEETRATIIVAAWEVIRERGFYGMSIALVAEQSDMTRAGLMYHFPTKEHLLVGVMESRFQENQAWFVAQLRAGRSVLDTIVDLTKRRVDDPETVTLLMVLAGAGIDAANPAHEWYAHRNEYIIKSLIGQVEAEQKRGTIRTDMDAKTVAVQLLSTQEGLLLHWLNDRDRFDLVEVTARCCDLYRPG